MSILGDSHPYADRFGVIRAIPEHGRDRDEVLAELRTIGEEEDEYWRSGKVSGTIYHGGLDHYDFLAEAFAPFAHANVLQRDLCPSATRFEGEIIAMALDLLHGGEVAARDAERAACGSVTSGGTESILSSVLAHREDARERRGVDRPNLVLPNTAHPAFHKAAHLFGLEVRTIAVDPADMRVDPNAVRAQVDGDTALIVGSAANYPYGTIDPIDALSDLALETGVGLHVDGCLGGYILPWGEQLGLDIPPFDFRLPGVTAISADTHKFGYGLKGASTVLFASHELRRRLYFVKGDWSGGKYFSPGLAGSRSGGLLASTWAAMVTTGRDGYLERARDIFDTAFAMQDAVRDQGLRIFGSPTFCFAFTADDFEIYHVNDHMKARGWRFNGLQYPNGLHFCVTGPQLRAGLVGDFEHDLAEAVAYGRERGHEPAESAAIYGGVPGGHTREVDEFLGDVVAQILDEFQSVPER